MTMMMDDIVGPMDDRLASRRTRRRPSGSVARESTTRTRRCSRRPSPPRRRRPRRACPRARTREARAFARRTSPPSREVRPTTPATTMRRHLDDALSTLDDTPAIDHRRAPRRMNILSVDIRARSHVHDVACGRIDVAMGVEWKPYRWKKPCVWARDATPRGGVGREKETRD